MAKSKSNTKGKSRGDIAADVRQKLGDPTFRKIIRIVVNTKKEDLKTLLAKIEVPKFVTFVVGKFFQHKTEGCVPQYHFDGFKNRLLNDAKEKVVSVGKAIKNFREYVLSQNMNDTAIQQNTKSVPVEENVFWATLYVLLSEGKLLKDKVYIMHVRKESGEIVAFRVGWGGDEWILRACEFGADDWWRQGNVFLFPATKAKA